MGTFENAGPFLAESYVYQFVKFFPGMIYTIQAQQMHYTWCHLVRPFSC